VRRDVPESAGAWRFKTQPLVFLCKRSVFLATCRIRIAVRYAQMVKAVFFIADLVRYLRVRPTVYL
jgi:hypothetical protein